MRANAPRLWLGLYLLLVLLFLPAIVRADAPAGADEDRVIPTAPVIVDGRTLFELRGVRALPAERRASEVEARIRALAADRRLDPNSLQVVETPLGSAIMAGQQRVLMITEADAQLESVDRHSLAEVALLRIRETIVSYRAARTRAALVGAAWKGSVATVLGLLAMLVLVRLARFVHAPIHRRLGEDASPDGPVSLERLRRERLRGLFRGLLRIALGLSLLTVAFLYLRYVLALLPWTRGAASQLEGWALAPLSVLGNGIVAQLPNLVFLAVLFLVCRYGLRLLRGIADAVGRGEIQFAGFEPEWAESTYKAVRLVIVVFAVIVGYPYIPGSSSDAFKGVSLFVGLVFSLGSSSLVSNVIAGYAITYRRAFHRGDRVQIAGVVGDIDAVRLQVTTLRTVKNELVLLPNATVLNGEVTNYSALARGPGLILHTTVGIGYETPWRQVEAMLLEAAARTPGLLRDRQPFVLQKSLGDFAVTYEINVYTDQANAMARVYTDLHRNILDVFNEHEVQIMTPAYEGDPEIPKVVPREKWHLAPAAPPSGE